MLHSCEAWDFTKEQRPEQHRNTLAVCKRAVAIVAIAWRRRKVTKLQEPFQFKSCGSNWERVSVCRFRLFPLHPNATFTSPTGPTGAVPVWKHKRVKVKKTCYRLIFHRGQFSTTSDCISADKGACEGRLELWPKYDEAIAAQTSFTVSHF